MQRPKNLVMYGLKRYTYSVKKIAAASAIVLFLCSACHADPLKSVAQRLAKEAARLPNHRIAVLLFPYDNGDVSSGSAIVSERLATLLSSNKHVTVVERSLLPGILEEMKLEESGATSEAGAAKPGKISNVDAIVTGTLSDDMEGITEVNARLINMETGEVLAAAAARFHRTWEDRPHSPVPPDNGEAGSQEYVLHASPLIPTPWARAQGASVWQRETPASAGSASGAGTGEAYAAPAGQAAPVATVAYVPVAIKPASHQADPAAHAQMYYALGITLDAQGQHQQARSCYQRVLSGNAASIPIRSRIETRLNSKL